MRRLIDAALQPPAGSLQTARIGARRSGGIGAGLTHIRDDVLGDGEEDGQKESHEIHRIVLSGEWFGEKAWRCRTGRDGAAAEMP
jgi:hypothetical protein